MVELDSKPHLMSECGVVHRIEIYCSSRHWRNSAFNPLDALPSHMIRGFESSSNIVKKLTSKLISGNHKKTLY
jgi:hypothetical protein